ncbi:MAG: MerR family transcriptional regulator [Solirubrobacterales bacterium]|nr:MerR family transcriptional regulator [Solirubrobacterales bacterium]
MKHGTLKFRMAGKSADTIELGGAGVATSDVDRAEGASSHVDPAEDGGSAYDLTIEQLAAESGMTVRNIRNHHTRGLLPPPEVRARVGYYSAEHVARLRLILDLQADGFNLAAIERLLGGSNGLAERLLGLRQAVTTPYEPESAELVTAQELDDRFGEVDAKDAERIRKLRLLVPLGDGRFEVPSPALLGAAEEVLALGIPLPAALTLVERIKRDCDSISRAFTKLFLRELWEPFERAGQPDDQWDELIEAVNSLRPLASEALLALFKQSMTTELEDAFGKVLEHQSKRGR